MIKKYSLFKELSFVAFFLMELFANAQKTIKDIFLKPEDFALQSSVILKSTFGKEELNIQVNSNISENNSFEGYNVLVQKFMRLKSNNLEAIRVPISQLSNCIYYSKTTLPASRTFKFLKIS